jgi:hypothetical protein
VPGVPRKSKSPSPVVRFTVTPENIEDLIAYVRTLKQKKTKRARRRFR